MFCSKYGRLLILLHWQTLSSEIALIIRAAPQHAYLWMLLGDADSHLQVLLMANKSYHNHSSKILVYHV